MMMKLAIAMGMRWMRMRVDEKESEQKRLGKELQMAKQALEVGKKEVETTILPLECTLLSILKAHIQPSPTLKSL